MKIIPAGALCVAALGCSALLAQSQGVPNPNVPPSATGVAPDTGEPSAATPGTTTPADAGSNVSHSATQTFITQAAYANQGEISAAHYALAHSHSDDVKHFAQQMIADHTKAGHQLERIANSHGFTVPSGLDEKDRATQRRLERAHGARFDAVYAKSQDDAHMEVVAMFKRTAENRRIDPAIRNFAQMTLPVLQDHLQMANQLVGAHPQNGNSVD